MSLVVYDIFYITNAQNYNAVKFLKTLFFFKIYKHFFHHGRKGVSKKILRSVTFVTARIYLQ